MIKRGGGFVSKRPSCTDKFTLNKCMEECQKIGFTDERILSNQVHTT